MNEIACNNGAETEKIKEFKLPVVGKVAKTIEQELFDDFVNELILHIEGYKARRLGQESLLTMVEITRAHMLLASDKVIGEMKKALLRKG